MNPTGLLILAIFIATGAFVLVLLILLGFRKGKRPLIWSCLLYLLFVVPCFALLYLYVTPFEPTGPLRLAKVYEAEFGTLPPPDVTGMKYKSVVVGDAYASWLKLKASPTTVSSLLGRFKPASDQDFRTRTRGGNMPDWWQPAADGMVHYYATKQVAPQFGESLTVLAHDASRQTVYFFRASWQ